MRLHPYRWLLGGLLLSPISLGVLLVLPPAVGLGWSALVTAGVLGWHFFPAPSRKRMRALLRIRPPRIPWRSVVGLIGGIFLIEWGLIASIELVFNISDRIDPNDIPFYFAEDLWESPVRIVALSLLMAVGIPAFEELVFRGRLQRHYERRGSMGKAILIPATIFAVGHAGGPHWSLLILFFSFALLQAGLTLHTGSILPAILAHSTWNGSLLLGGIVSEWPALTAGALAAVGSLFVGAGVFIWGRHILRNPGVFKAGKRVGTMGADGAAREHTHA